MLKIKFCSVKVLLSERKLERTKFERKIEQRYSMEDSIMIMMNEKLHKNNESELNTSR